MASNIESQKLNPNEEKLKSKIFSNKKQKNKSKQEQLKQLNKLAEELNSYQLEHNAPSK